MSKKVDFFAASKDFSARVNEYMTATVWSVIINKRYQLAVEKVNTQIANVQEVIDKPNTSKIISKDQAQELLVAFQNELATLEKKHNDDMEAQGKFTLNDLEKDFYVEYKNAGTVEQVATAIVNFCKNYKLDLSGTDLLNELSLAITGRKPASARQIVTSGATKFTGTRSRKDVLSTFYGVLTEKMIAAGTLKVMAIPEDVRAAYDKKKGAK